jgi:hypothetical protein
MVSTGFDTVPATDTEIVVDVNFFSGAVIAVLYWACRDTGVTVYAFLLVYLDYRC